MHYVFIIIQSSNMDEHSSVLSEIVKAKENIKQKYKLIKTNEADTKTLVTQTFEPIIEPLNRLSNNLQEIPLESRDAVRKNISKQYNRNISSWFDSENLDRTYGPKRSKDNVISLGNKIIFFTDNELQIEEKSYTLTPGVISLIFLKNPVIYSEADLETYKQILIKTSVHLTADGSKIKKRSGRKYSDIIVKIFPTGGGLSMKLQKHQLVYWDDPNELVDRLRILLSAQSAGNTGVSNEIISVFEELFEAGIIKRIPNVKTRDCNRTS